MTDHRQSQEIIQQPNTSSWKNTGSKTDKEQYLILRQQCCFAEGISRCLTASNPARARTYRGWVYRTKCSVPVYFMASGSCLLSLPCICLQPMVITSLRKARIGVLRISAHKHFMDLCSFTSEVP